MILGLILSTLHQLSEPEPSILDPRPVLTPIAFRHFPSEEFATTRARFFRNKNKTNIFTPPRVPTLVELLLHHMATRPLSFIPEYQTHHYSRLKEDIENLEQYTGPLRDNLPFYLDYQGEPIDNERMNKRRPPAQTGPRLLYLTSATLVVGSSACCCWYKKIIAFQFLQICFCNGRRSVPFTAKTRCGCVSSEDATQSHPPVFWRPNMMFASQFFLNFLATHF